MAERFKSLKSIALYAAILAGGLAAGTGVANVVPLLKSSHTTADNTAYFQAYQSKVVLYGTASCGYCAKTRAYLKERKIAYADLDVEQSAQAQREFKQFGAGGVPYLLIGDRRIQGFNTSAIDSALQKLSN
jgi:glutaredoxin